MSKWLKSLLLIILLIIIFSGVFLYFILNSNEDRDSTEAKSIDQLIKFSYESPEITTDLKDGSFVKIQFQIITDGKEALAEISKRDFQLKNILIKELANIEEEQFRDGLTELEKTMKKRLNKLMDNGEIIEVYTISKIIQ